MPILTQDIKLLKSSVMADTTDGGGQMTGTAIVDGQSNNLFPDTSAMDRAFGRVNLRKVFGVAHTTDTATLLGAHAIITDSPDDPLVACTLVKTTGWADQRATAQDVIERYVVKGPKASVRIYDTHYTGSLQLRLISFVNTAFPAGGDAVVLTNPNGTEQYVRILKISTISQQVAVVENGNTTVFPATIATCELGQALTMDVLGPPAARAYGVNGLSPESSYATLYTTSVATGAKFYGVKPLGIAGSIGDLSITTSDGVYTNLVPAATVESPVIDQYPMLQNPGVSTSGIATITITNPTAHAWGPGSTITTPTLITPGSFSMSYNGVNFTDSGDGVLMQGTNAVGVVSYRTSTVSLNPTAPGYGGANISTVTYKPASPSGPAVFSDLLMITTANQGLSFTAVLTPFPAKGTLSMSYMAQGRWYTLMDNDNGKLSGSSSSYGVGTINYTTGSISLTLGAMPDVGSPLLFQWGTAKAAQPVTGTLPTAASFDIEIPPNSYPGDTTLSWTTGGVAKSCTVNGAGTVSGAATGGLSGPGKYTVTPTLFPTSNVTVNYKTYVQATAISHGTGKNWTITGPVQPGTVHFQLALTAPADCAFSDGSNGVVYCYDDGAGNIKSYITSWWTNYASANLGTINYATGAISITTASVSQYVLHTYQRSRTVWFHTDNWTETAWEVQPCTITETLTNLTYCGGTGTTQSLVVTPSMYLQVPTTADAKLALTGASFTVGGDLYTSVGGALRSGWSLTAAVPSISVSAGNVVGSGKVTLTVLPANNTNTVVWQNVAIDLSGQNVMLGAFRTVSAPLKAGNFQLSAGVSSTGSASAGGVLSGEFTGTVDYVRGWVQWQTATMIVNPSTLRYNAVLLQYLPLDASLLGMNTARLPLDGRVPVFRNGDLLVVHNTLTFTFPNPLVKNTNYDLGRVRIASVRVKDALGVVVPDTLYSVNLDAGTISVPTASNITSYTQPFTCEHRIEDMLLCSQVDISGKLSVTRSLTHNFPANTSFVSSAMPFGDLFARTYSVFGQGTWTSVWQDTIIGAAIIPQFNTALNPITVTNQGAIKERWVLIFTNSTSYRIIGESVGEIGSGSTGVNTAPLNPATNTPYFTIPAAGWGTGWAAGNCLRFNTDACGAPFWAVRTVLQGPATLASDQFTLAFRGDVDRP